MPLHPEARALIEMMAALGDPPLEEDTPAAARARRYSRLRPSTLVLDEIRPVDAGGVPCRLYRPTSASGLGLVVYFHGGGWVLGDLDSHDGVCRALVQESGCCVLSVGYRLAPEDPFPAAVADATTATRWAVTHAAELGVDPTRVAVAGDSAGGGLATVVAQLGVADLRFQLLVYPVTDARRRSNSYREFADGPFLTARGMGWFINHYLSGPVGSTDDPRVSPLLAGAEAIANVPPGLVITAEMDPLRDDGEAYAARLNEAGIATSLVRYHGMFHGFFSMSDFLGDSRLALAQAGRALRDALATPVAA